MRAEEVIGQMLGHYRIIRPLGYGGTATVFLAEDINLQREVAVKVYLPGADDTKDFLRRFAREARVLAQLDHPNILPVYDYGEQNSLAYLVMPLMAGGSLRDRLRSRNTVSATEAVRMMGQILNALQYAHDRGLIHRDIKPGNMLFKADGTLMLSDFGLVKVVSPTGDIAQTSDATSMTGRSIAGTPDYMAPEQILGQVSPISDIYGVGVALYEMLTGARLFTAENYIGMLMKHLHEQPRPLRQLNPNISPALEAVVMRALAKDPTQRYQRPIDFLQALNRAIAADSSSTLAIENERTMAATWQPPTQLNTSEPPLAQQPPSHPATPVQPSLTQEQKDGESGEHGHTAYTGGMIIKAQQATPVTPSSPTQRDTRQTPSSPNNAPQANAAYGQWSNAIQQSAHPAPYSAAPPQAPLVTPSRGRQTKHTPVALLVVLVLVILALATSLSVALFAPQVFGLHPGILPTPTTGGGNGHLQTPISTVQKNIPTQAVTTTAVPQTTTACPAAGTARAAILSPLALGNHQNFIYIVNEGTFDHPTFGTVKRKDVTAYLQNPTLQGIEISKMSGVYISEAQVSQDGQWVLFTAKVNGNYQLRMVRVDGQGLQTLYCATPGTIIAATQWSFDQKQAVFNVGNNVDLLNLTNGQVQTELIPDAGKGYVPRTWLDNSRIYLIGITPNSDAPPQNVYLLDIHKGPNQHSSDLQTIVNSTQSCTSFDTSYDSTLLYVATCTNGAATGAGPGASTGPSTIAVLPAAGGVAQPVYNNPNQGITLVRAVSKTTLLFQVNNYSGDTTQNGLWKINTDGSGSTHLSTDPNNTQSLCMFTQYAWSNVSRDGTLYALQSYDPKTNTYGLSYGSLGGGTPTEFASISDGTQLYLAGWTTL
jgi:serine/threonine protein kinase